MRILGGFFLLSIFMFGLFSCTGSQTSTSPAAQPDLSTQNISCTADQVCWGLWDVYIDPGTGSVNTVPIRGASFMVNVVNFLQPPGAPINLLTLAVDPGGTDFASGLVTCDVTIQHPFPGTKFAGFDVMGIVLDDWTTCSSPSEPDILTSLPPYTLLQNPDGWTRWWNQAEFTTYGTLLGYTEGALANHSWTCTHTLNAFKYFCDDLEAEDPFDPDPATRGFFSSDTPGINSRRYVLQFPVDGGPIFHFKYSISASWEAPDGTAIAPFTPDDFTPEANMAEAYKIKIINSGSTAYYEDGSSFGGNLNLYIEVRDWQLDGTLGSVTEEIESITIASPTLFPTPVTLDLGLAQLVPGNPTAVRIPVTIEDVTPSGVDNQLLIVRVKSAHVTTYEPQIPGIGGYAYPAGPLAAYGIFEAPVIAEGVEEVWPMFHRDHSRTGQTSIAGPSTANVKFTWEVPISYGGVFGGIVLDSMGRAFVPSQHLYCISPDGEVVWSYPAAVSTYNTPSVGPDDSIYFGHHVNDTTGAIYHIDKNGELLWCEHYPSDRIDGGIALLPGGCILFGGWGGFMVKADPMGNEIWTYDTDEYAVCGGPSVANDGTIYFADLSSRVYALNQDGDEVWKTNCMAGEFCTCPVLSPERMFLGSKSKIMCCLDHDGHIKWKTELGGGIHASAAVGDDGNIYVGAMDKKLYCIDQDNGAIKWSYQTSHQIFSISPVLDGAGHVYQGNTDGNFYCLTTDGDLVWEMDIGDEINCRSPAIAEDGTLYVATKGGSFYAFKDE